LPLSLAEDFKLLFRSTASRMIPVSSIILWFRRLQPGGDILRVPTVEDLRLVGARAPRDRQAGDVPRRVDRFTGPSLRV